MPLMKLGVVHTPLAELVIKIPILDLNSVQRVSLDRAIESNFLSKLQVKSLLLIL